ncbi:integrase [Pelobium manganitolerans]|uniref:Tyrosine recombinase XerC n=1 Tax=Pelobium manganitolerans TaxID=1842495 RepID=A0A419S7P5_9SPHI|nr:tyrosine-type recombinase/integrase [Pelobium manganitolerans]RKD17517.1 integrase [Pelobium manganitolerans]
MELADFLKYLTYEKRCSKHTLAAYENDIAQFQSFLQQSDQTFSQASHKDIRLWIISLMDDGLDARSVNRKMSSLRAFYKFGLRENLLSVNPTLKVQSPKMSKKLPVFVSDDKMDALLDSDIFSDDFNGCRDKLIIELLFATGIRLNELLTLQQRDVLLNEGTIKVLGKRNKQRIVPLTDVAVSAIKAYLIVKERVQPVEETGLLLVTDKGKPAYAKLVYRVVNNYLKIISTQNKKSPHILRHSFATSLLNKGADINAIKDLLGHASLAATQVYTHNSIERLKSIYKQAHPKA